MSISTKISALFSTISGLCAAIGGAQAFQVFGDSTPLGHKVTAGIMLVGIIFAYLANSPLFKPAAPVGTGGVVSKVGVIALFLALIGTISSCAHVQPIAACATDIIVQAIEDALIKDPNWEAELATARDRGRTRRSSSVSSSRSSRALPGRPATT